MKIKLIKFRDDLIPPIRAHYNDAGIDCFAQDDFDINHFKSKALAPKDDTVYYADRIMVPLGFGLEIPDGYMAVIKPRSSMNAKGIITQIGTIDSGYRGEIKAIFINTSPTADYSFKRGDKICQIVIEPVILADIVEELGDERKDGGFGSTGK